MSEQITLKEVLELVTFEKDDGEWGVKDVRGSVWGDVEGNVRGSVLGHVKGKGSVKINK